jgi:spermidine/putrescine-binding protein
VKSGDVSELSVSRRSLLQGIATVGVAGTLCAPAIVRAAPAGELRILFPGGTWKDWFDQTFVQPFAKESGTKVEWKTGMGFEPLVLAERRRPQWDLIHESQNTSSQLGAMDAIIAWTQDQIPNIAKIHPAFRYEYLVGKIHTPYGIVWNTKKITRPINSWWDLWDPAFAGKVAFPDWVWLGQDVFYAINALSGGDASNIDLGIAKMKELFTRNKAQIIRNVEQTQQVLVSEDVWICPLFGARAEKAKQAGAPVDFVLPKEGGLSWIWNTSIIAGRPQDSIELAQQFVNTTLEADKQIEFARLTGYPPTNLDAIKNLPPDLKHLAVTDKELKAIGDLQRKFDYLTQFKNRDRTQERWEKEVLGT